MWIKINCNYYAEFFTFASNPYTMVLQAFQYLSIKDKVAFIHSFGEFLMERRTNVYRVVLYHCEDFFTEIWYHSDFHEVDYVRAFKSVDILEPYLPEITIDSIFLSIN
jgi:hypothetical protein